MLVLLDSGTHALGLAGTDLSPFERDRGDEQGRIPSATATDGSFVYELGHAQREGGSFEVGDFHEITQAVTPDGNAQLIRVDVNVLLPTALPTSPAVEWEFTVRFKGVVKYTRRFRVEQRTLALRDIAISLAASAPTDDVTFRLELVAA